MGKEAFNLEHLQALESPQDVIEAVRDLSERIDAPMLIELTPHTENDAGSMEPVLFCPSYMQEMKHARFPDDTTEKQMVQDITHKQYRITDVTILPVDVKDRNDLDTARKLAQRLGYTDSDNSNSDFPYIGKFVKTSNQS